MKREKYTSKGKMFFFYSEKGINLKKKNFEEGSEKTFGEKTIYELYDGKQFLEEIEKGNVIDYKGELLNVFVDGYISNLGLHDENFSQGNFLVDKKTFLELCENHEVKVNWGVK